MLPKGNDYQVRIASQPTSYEAEIIVLAGKIFIS
jgi:hypothetical protein